MPSKNTRQAEHNALKAGQQDPETPTESESGTASCTSKNEGGHVLCSMARGAPNDTDVSLDCQGPPKPKNKTQWPKVCVSFTRTAHYSLILVSSLRLVPLRAIPKVQPVNMSLLVRNGSWRSSCGAISKVENAKTKLARWEMRKERCEKWLWGVRCAWWVYLCYRPLYLLNWPSTLFTGKQTSSATSTVLSIPSPTCQPPPALPSSTRPLPPALLSPTHPLPSAPPLPTHLLSLALSMPHEPSVDDSESDQLAEDVSEPLQNGDHSKDTNKSHSGGLFDSVKGK